jgi:hypothetical protein
MDANKQQIIDMISEQISMSLSACEHHRNGEYITSYTKRVELLRNIRTQLENEFTVIHYDPR